MGGCCAGQTGEFSVEKMHRELHGRLQPDAHVVTRATDELSRARQHGESKHEGKGKDEPELQTHCQL